MTEEPEDYNMVKECDVTEATYIGTGSAGK